MSLSEKADQLYNDVLELFDHDKVDMTNVFQLLRLSMETVETYTGLKGADKKALVIAVVQRFVDHTFEQYDEPPGLKEFVKYAIDKVIDNLVDVNDGGMTINKGFFSKITSCCRQ